MSKKDKPAEKGHNRVGNVNAEQLQSIIDRVENLQEDKKGVADDIRDVFNEAKGNGFDVKTIREIIKLRAMDAQEREEKDALISAYQRALGMLALE